jgi:SAM-dependent methyltransferase
VTVSRTPYVRSWLGAYEPVEAWWERRAGARTAAARVRPRVVEAARALSDLFTTGRPEAFPDYSADPDALAAHGLWFFPRTWAQVRFPLAEAVERCGFGGGGDASPPASRSVLDVGSGAGAAGLSLAWDLLARGLASSVRLVAVDRSPDALAALRRLASDVPPPAGSLEVETHVVDVAAETLALGVDALARRAQGGGIDLVVAAHVLNEAFAAKPETAEAERLVEIASTLAPHGLLLVVEPGLRATSLRLRRVAALASENGALFPWAPELSGTPWRPVESGRFWPHEVRRWKAPARARALERALGRPESDLTFSFGLLGKRPAPPVERSPSTFRLTSPIASAKGRFLWTGLGADGLDHRYDLLRRHAEAGDLARLREAERGDVLHAAHLEPSGGERSWRVGSGADLAVRWHPRGHDAHSRHPRAP